MLYAIVGAVIDGVPSARGAKAGTCGLTGWKSLSVVRAKRLPQFVVSGATIADATVKNYGDGLRGTPTSVVVRRETRT